MNPEEKKAFEKSTNKAQSILNDPEKTKRLLDQVRDKSEGKEGLFDNLWEDLQSLIRMLNSWRLGKYKDISKRSMAMVAGALLYFVSPIDLIPDFLLMVGFADDIAVLGFVINRLRKEVNKFKAWEKGQIFADVNELEEGEYEVVD